MSKGNIARITVTVMPDTTQFRASLRKSLEAIERYYRSRPVEIRVEPVLDRAKVQQVRRQLQAAFKDLDVDIRPDIDSTSFAAAKARLDAIARDRRVDIDPVMNLTSIAATRAVMDRVLGRDIDVDVELDKTSVVRARTQLFRSNWTKAVDVAFVPGSLDGLERTFYGAFPSLRMWVWPQLDPAGLRELGARAKQTLTNLQRFFSRQKVTVSAAWDQVAASRVSARLRTWSRSIKAKIPDRVKTTVDAVIARDSWAATYAQIARLEAWTKVRSRKIIQITMRGASQAWKWYTRLGIRSLVRWNIQLQVTQAIEGLKKLASIVGSTAKAVAGLSALAMGVGEILALAGNVTVALKRIAPAIWPAVGVAASLAAGLGVAVVALKDAKDELDELGPKFDLLQDKISAAFWVNARVPILENVSRLIDELDGSLERLGSAMGDVFASMARGLGNSSDQIKGFLDSTTTGFTWLAPAMQRFIEGFLRLLEAGAEFFPRFALWMDGLSISFTSWIDRIESEQGLYNWMNKGWEATKALGGVLGNLFGLLKDVSVIAADAGLSMEEYNDKLIAIRETLNQPEMRNGVTNLVSGARDGFQQISSAVGRVIGTLGQYGYAIGAIIRDVGGVFADVIDGIASALLTPAVFAGIHALVGGFGSLVDALTPVVAQLASNFAPIIGQVGDLLTLVAPQVETLGMFLADLAGVTFANIADLASALLPAILGVLNNIMPSLIAVAEATLPLIVQSVEMLLPLLAPIVEELATGLLDIILELAPVLMQFSDAFLPQLVEAFGLLVPVVLDLIELAIEPLLLALELLGPVLGLAADGIVAGLEPAAAGLSATLEALRVPFVWLRERLQDFRTWLDSGSEGAGMMKSALGFLKPVLGGFAGAVVVSATGMRVLSTVMRVLRPVITIISGAFKLLTGTIATIGRIITWGVSAVKGLVAAFRLLWIVLSANPVGAIIAAIAAVVAAVVWFFTQTEIGRELWQKFMNFLKGVWETLQRVGKEVWEDITEFVADAAEGVTVIWDAVVGFFSNAWDQMKAVVAAVADWFKGQFEEIGALWNTVWEGVSTFFSNAWEQMKAVVAAVVGWFQGQFAEIGEMVSGVMAWVSETWNTAWTAVSEFAAEVWNGLVELFTMVVDSLTQAWEWAWTAIPAFLASAWQLIDETVQAGIYAARDFIQSGLETIRTTWNNTWSAVRDWASSTWESIKSAVSSAVSSVRDKISDVMGQVSTKWSTAWSGVRDLASNVWGQIKSTFSNGVSAFVAPFVRMGEGIKDAFRNAFNAIANLWNSTVGQLSFTVPSWVPGVGGNGWSAPKIPLFAEGGIVTKPTLGWIGEAGDEEAVIPLPRLQPMIDEAVSKSVRDHHGQAQQNVYHVNMNVDAKDLQDLRSLAKFVDMLKLKIRMTQGA